MAIQSEKLTYILAGIERRKAQALANKALENDLAYYSLSDACWLAQESARAMYRVTARGNPTLKSIVRLADVLEVTPEWLLTGLELPEEVNHERID